MNNPDLEKTQSRRAGGASEGLITNTVALTGVVLAVVAVALYAWLFYAVSLLPGDPEEFRLHSENAPTQVRLIVLASAAGVVNVVALGLCVVGLILPGRPRLLATIGIIATFALLVGVFGVLAVGVMLGRRVPASAVGTSTAMSNTAETPYQLDRPQ